MQALMNPRSVGVIGASEKSSRSLRALRNLSAVGFQGDIYPINPKYEEVTGLRCYPSAAATPKPADLVIVAIPAPQVADVLAEAHEAGVRAALVLAAGFGEAGEEGRRRHAALAGLAERGMLICGPNCYGVLNLHAHSGAWGGELPNPMLPGNVALVSQSGGTCGLITNPLARERKVGFSFVVSCGNQAGVPIEDYLEYLVDDPATEVIAAFVEGFRQPRRLPGIAARAATLGKPIVVLKVGRSAEARRNALTHTGSLAGDADIMDALLRQHAIIQVSSLDELNETVALLALAKDRPAGRRVGVLSGSGGECGRFADAAQEVGLGFPPLSTAAAGAITAALPEFASPANPLDGTGALYDYPEAFPAVAAVLLGEGFDVTAFNINALPPYGSGRAPQRNFARQLAEIAKRRDSDRLVVAYGSLTLGTLDAETIDALREAGIPYLESPEKALRALASLAWWQSRLALPPRKRAGERARGLPAGSGRLPFMQTAELLRQFGIPVIPTRACRSPDEAVQAAEQLGYPVAVKADVAHKSDAGAIRLGLTTPEAVRDAFASMGTHDVLVQAMAGAGLETIIGIKQDPLVGPALVFGLGGIFTEVMRDVALRIPPIDEREAESMIEDLRGEPVFHGIRGRPPADIPALAAIIVRAGDMALALGDRLAALDLNPLIVYPEGGGVVAVDALMELS
jgi:acyl-CoA synthetase (NDP forming)